MTMCNVDRSEVNDSIPLKRSMMKEMTMISPGPINSSIHLLTPLLPRLSRRPFLHNIPMMMHV
jgi:hypothetical protein